MTNRNRFIAFLMIMAFAVAPTAQSQDRETKRPTIRKSVEQTEQESAFKYEDRRIASLEFRGNEKFSSDTILEYMKLVKKGDFYNKEKLENDLSRARALLYADRGYLKIQFGEPEIEETSEGLRVVITVEEGLPYRFGEIKVEDATVFSPDEIIRIIGAKSGDIIKGYSVIQKGLDRLRRFYANRGYIQFSTSPQIDYKPSFADPQEGIADVTFEIEEGNKYTIRRVEFAGSHSMNRHSTDDSIWRVAQIHFDVPFSYNLLDGIIRRLNKWGRFEKLTEEDCEINLDEQTHTVDILIKLKEKNR